MSFVRKVFLDYLGAIFVAVIYLTFFNCFLLKMFYVPSDSMENALVVGDHVIVNRYVYSRSRLLSSINPQTPVSRGDIIVFRSPTNPQADLIKRCIGLPGETIEIINKTVVINGRQLDEDYAIFRDSNRIFPNRRYIALRYRKRDNFDAITLSPGHYFFLGDNRDLSYDSRHFGLVPSDSVRGKASVIYWSYSPQPQQCFLSGINWERTLMVIT